MLRINNYSYSKRKNLFKPWAINFQNDIENLYEIFADYIKLFFPRNKINFDEDEDIQFEFVMLLYDSSSKKLN